MGNCHLGIIHNIDDYKKTYQRYSFHNNFETLNILHMDFDTINIFSSLHCYSNRLGI